MPRNMSFALTTQQIRNKTKTVTRRFGWFRLKVGDEIWAVEKAMGLKSGEKIKKLALITIKSIRTEPLESITKDDCIKEGFPEMEPSEFVAMICKHYRCTPQSLIRRIESEYIWAIPSKLQF